MSRGMEIEGVTYDAYLGDGIYAGFDGTQVWLGTQREVWHRIALGASVFVRLEEYLAWLRKVREDTGK